MKNLRRPRSSDENTGRTDPTLTGSTTNGTSDRLMWSRPQIIRGTNSRRSRTIPDLHDRYEPFTAITTLREIITEFFSNSGRVFFRTRSIIILGRNRGGDTHRYVLRAKPAAALHLSGASDRSQQRMLPSAHDDCPRPSRSGSIQRITHIQIKLNGDAASGLDA